MTRDLGALTVELPARVVPASCVFRGGDPKPCGAPATTALDHASFGSDVRLDGFPLDCFRPMCSHHAQVMASGLDQSWGDGPRLNVVVSIAVPSRQAWRTASRRTVARWAA